MSSLRSSLNELASTFASSILAAVRGASLDELVGKTDSVVRRGPGRPPKAKAAPTAATAPTAPTMSKGRKSGRLPRRSADDITKALDQVVALVRKHKGGLRAEQIRASLGMEAKEMPRILKEGLAKKKLKSKGQKRATTYTAA
jgi:hypothetical protein